MILCGDVYESIKWRGVKEKSLEFFRNTRLSFNIEIVIAEEEGFEPPEPVKVLRFSRPVQ